MNNSDTCRSCGAAVRWSKSPKGANLPLDRDPTDPDTAALKGFTVLYALAGPSYPGEAPQAVAFTRSEYAAGFAEHSLYPSHFATCPNAAQHSRRSKK